MCRLNKNFEDGSALEYGRGDFDNWCVYLTRPDKGRRALTDMDYFSQLKEYGIKYGNDRIYADYCRIYEATGKEPDQDMFDLIEAIASEYDKEDELEIYIAYSVLYMTMVSEENRRYTRLGRRIKRLGIHEMLINNSTVHYAATFMNGRGWREIDKLCADRGF